MATGTDTQRAGDDSPPIGGFAIVTRVKVKEADPHASALAQSARMWLSLRSFRGKGTIFQSASGGFTVNPGVNGFYTCVSNYVANIH